MRTVSITVHNNEKFEIFVKRKKSEFELWNVGPVKGRRRILDHYLTHDDLEAKLEYANSGDLVWRNAKESDLPRGNYFSASKLEAAANARMFLDFKTNLAQPLVYHIASSVNLLPLVRKVFISAQKTIMGCWTDGTARVSIKSGSELAFSYLIERPHPLNSHWRMHGYHPDHWNFKGWQLFLWNKEHGTAMRIGVIRVDERELHIWNEQHPHRIAHVFRRLNA